MIAGDICARTAESDAEIPGIGSKRPHTPFGDNKARSIVKGTPVSFWRSFTKPVVQASACIILGSSPCGNDHHLPSQVVYTACLRRALIDIVF